jgi:hypothetical protein
MFHLDDSFFNTTFQLTSSVPYIASQLRVQLLICALCVSSSDWDTVCSWRVSDVGVDLSFVAGAWEARPYLPATKLEIPLVNIAAIE